MLLILDIQNILVFHVLNCVRVSPMKGVPSNLGCDGDFNVHSEAGKWKMFSCVCILSCQCWVRLVSTTHWKPIKWDRIMDGWENHFLVQTCTNPS